MKKSKLIWIIGGFSLFILLLLVIFFINKNDNKNLNEIAGFEYYSGSTSLNEQYSGTRDGNKINIEFHEFNSGDQNSDDFIITFNDFKELIKSTKKCTNDYEREEEGEGGWSSSFWVTFKNNEQVCYESNYRVNSFFDNLAAVYNQLDYSTLSEEEKNEINLIELLEDIKSIKDSDELIEIENANQTESLEDAIVYEGKGYLIKLIYNGDKTNCLINSKDGNKIWYIEK